MFPMTMSFTITNEQQLSNLLAAAYPTLPTPAGPMMTATEVQARQRGLFANQAQNGALAEQVKKPAPAPKAEVAPAQPTATELEVAAPEPKVESSESKAYTIDDAKALTMKIVADKGRNAAVDLLGKYGVPVAAKLQADQIADFCTDAEKVLA